MEKEKAIEKIEKAVLSCQTMDQLRTATQLVENAHERGIIDWMELRSFYQTIRSKEDQLQVDSYKYKG